MKSVAIALASFYLARGDAIVNGCETPAALHLAVATFIVLFHYLMSDEPFRSWCCYQARSSC